VATALPEDEEPLADLASFRLNAPPQNSVALGRQPWWRARSSVRDQRTRPANSAAGLGRGSVRRIPCHEVVDLPGGGFTPPPPATRHGEAWAPPSTRASVGVASRRAAHQVVPAAGPGSWPVGRSSGRPFTADLDHHRHDVATSP
jgi:hypothetical protein